MGLLEVETDALIRDEAVSLTVRAPLREGVTVIEPVGDFVEFKVPLTVAVGDLDTLDVEFTEGEIPDERVSRDVRVVDVETELLLVANTVVEEVRLAAAVRELVPLGELVKDMRVDGEEESERRGEREVETEAEKRGECEPVEVALEEAFTDCERAGVGEIVDAMEGVDDVVCDFDKAEVREKVGVDEPSGEGEFDVDGERVTLAVTEA